MKKRRLYKRVFKPYKGRKKKGGQRYWVKKRKGKETREVLFDQTLFSKPRPKAERVLPDVPTPRSPLRLEMKPFRKRKGGDFFVDGVRVAPGRGQKIDLFAEQAASYPGVDAFRSVNRAKFPVDKKLKEFGEERELSKSIRSDFIKQGVDTKVIDAEIAQYDTDITRLKRFKPR